MASRTLMHGRDDHLDIAKGLGIFLVVLGHNWIILGSMGELFRVVYSFHLPLFFALSGVFLKESEAFGGMLKAKAASLLKPFFVVLSLLGLARYLAASPASPFDLTQYVLGVAWATGSTLQWVPLWFLPHLFLVLTGARIIIGMLRRIPDSQQKLSVIACVSLTIGIHVIDMFWRPGPGHPTRLDGSWLPGLPWSLDLAPTTMAFVLFGHVLRERIRAGAHSIPCFVVALAAFVAFHHYSDETINLNMRNYGQPVIASLQAAAGIYIALFVASRLQRVALLRRPLSYLGQASLIVLIFHRFFQDKVFVHLSALSESNFVCITASLAAGVLGPLIIWEMARRQKFVEALLLSRRANFAGHEPIAIERSIRQP